MTAAAQLILDLRASGASVAAKDGRLRVDARPGVLNPDVRAALTRHKGEVLTLLAAESVPDREERLSIQEEPAREATPDPWDATQAHQIVRQTIEDVAAEHRVGSFNPAAFRSFDQALVRAFATADLAAVRTAGREYRRAAEAPQQAVVIEAHGHSFVVLPDGEPVEHWARAGHAQLTVSEVQRLAKASGDTAMPAESVCALAITKSAFPGAHVLEARRLDEPKPQGAKP